VGLDIEPGAVAAAQVVVNGSLSVAQTASAPLAPNVVRDGEVADVEALAEALKNLFRDHKLDRRVRIGVANQRIVVRMLELPPVEDAKELDAVVRFHAQDELPMPLDEAVIDFHALGVVETDAGPKQRVVLVAARRAMIENVVGAARKAGLRPEGIDLSAFAMVRALGDGDPAPTLFLAVGGLTNLAIAEAGTVLFTRVSGIGLEGMAGVLAERRGMSIDEARAALLHTGLTGAVEPGAEEEAGMARSVLAEGVRRIAGEARASLDFHHAASTGGAPVERAVVTGPVVAVPGFVEALTEELGLPVVAGTVPGTDSDATGARYAVAAGLALEEALS
jgi:type IV pilus assembly protein PilM